MTISKRGSADSWKKTSCAAPEADPERLAYLEVALDQCWDLLRQRRAQREFGGDGRAASVRDAETVEHYDQ